jgi:hypothetical protein
VRRWYQDRTRWTVTVTSTDLLYDVAHRWFTDGNATLEPPRALSARYRRGRNYDRFPGLGHSYGNGKSDEQIDVELYYDEQREREVTIDGHKVMVSMTKPELGGSDNGGGFRPLAPEVLSFHARSRAGQQVVIDMLRNLAQKRERRRPALHLMNTYGDWERRDDLPERTLDSVVLAEGQMERIRDDIQRFMDAEPEYNRRGVPWHRGYLFHGPPGTGKTSVVRALAAHFGFDLWYAPLGDLQKDNSLLNLISQVGPRSILLLEDVDVFHATRSRQDDSSGVSMAGLLNALDGVATPHGLISVMTTNDLSVIDEAVMRPGRIDLCEEIGLPDAGQIVRLFEQWYGVTVAESLIKAVTFKGSTAEATELFKRNMNDAEGAWKALTTP